jgi:membrane protein
MVVKNAKVVYEFGKGAVNTFIESESMLLTAALAFYTIFSLPPLLIIIISIAGTLLGEEEVRENLFQQFEEVFGRDGANMIQNMLDSFQQDETGWAGTALWIGILVFTSTTFFVTMQNALNKIWSVQANPDNALLRLIRDRLLSFGIIISIAFLLLISFVINAGLAILSDYLQQRFPDATVFVMQALGIFISILITTLLFALIFKYLPDTIIRWREVWLGSFVTALLFEIGRFLIGVYIGQSEIASAYGAAGSIVVILIWVQYSSLILFFGAALTREFTQKLGGYILPQEHAVRVSLEQKPVDEQKEKDKNEGRPPADGSFRKK